MFTNLFVKRVLKMQFLQLFKQYKCVYALQQKCLSFTLNNKTPRNVYLMDENDDKVANSIPYSPSKFTERSFTCGDLRREHIGQTVVLCGWLCYQRMNKFVVLRDGYGETQFLIDEKDKNTQQLLETLPFESILKITGTVLSRPNDMINKKQITGEIEVLVKNLIVLNRAENKLPFNIRDFQKAKENLRMQYRYLDLRFKQMQHNMRTRSNIIMAMRDYLINKAHFVDVETPTLFKATPGGAQEFIVPTRFPGQFYSLVQSPQQFKQMLMAGAIDRYFQVARCYRDEGSRPDRQPEFTQLDIEMSFTNMDGVMALVEELLQYCWPDFVEALPYTFPKFTYKEAHELYGTDKPDTRFDFKLHNCTDVLKTNENLLTDDFGAYCIIIPKELSNLSKSIKNKLTELAQKYPKTKFLQSKITNKLEWVKKISKLLQEETAMKLANKIDIQDGCVLFLAFGNKKYTQSLLGKVRVEYANYLEESGLKIRKNGMHLLWIVDFPLFEMNEDTNTLNSAHHPFTAPHPDDIHLLKTNPLKVRALAYDLVLNGNEIGGGSIRIHDPNLQEDIFKLLNIDVISMLHMIDMLKSGCPPHGGIALGLDRFLAVLLGTVSIRDVIAFPKTFEGRDPISGAPSTISEQDKKLYHIETIKC